MKKYLRMSKIEYELIIKLVLCTIIAMLFSWMIGDAYSPTIAVTANLFLYCDRGYRGSLRYGSRRVLVQIIQGLFVIVLIFPCKYFEIPIPDVILIIISSCIALCVGLPINYKNTYSPANCTLANTTFIIACSTVHNINTFPKRVLQCIIGFMIGYFVNYIIFSYKDRVSEIQCKIRECVNELIDNTDFNVYYRNISLIEKDLNFLIEDSEKGNKKLRISKEKINYLQVQKKLLVSLKDYLESYQKYKNKLSDEFKMEINLLFCQASTIHLSLIKNFDELQLGKKIIELPTFAMDNSVEICVAGRLIEYTEKINSYRAL